MCLDCYQQAGSPKIDNELVRDLVKAIDAVYYCSCVGGHLHILLDDWNTDCLQSCIEWHERNENDADAEQLAAEAKCIELLKRASQDEISSALAICEGYFEVEGLKAENYQCRGRVI